MNLSALPFLGTVVSAINLDIEQFGFLRGMRKLITRTRSRVVTQGLDKTSTDILQKAACVVVANHPYEGEVIALAAALPERRDVSLILNYRFRAICLALHPYSIPVYIEHHRQPHHARFLRWFGERILPKQEFTEDVEHKKNIASIGLASRKVDLGCLVIRAGRSGKDFMQQHDRT